MLVTESVELGQALATLATRRPVFHSEADFQHALAWELSKHDPVMEVRLETSPTPGTHLDLWCIRRDLSRFTAIEVKYLTRSWSGELEGERYELKNHGAQNIRGYDVVKDIARVEQFISGRVGTNGAVLVLSNDPYYWHSKPGVADTTAAAAFRLREGAVLAGDRNWGPNMSENTLRKKGPISLQGTYELRWQDYTTAVSSGSAPLFRWLLIPVLGAASVT